MTSAPKIHIVPVRISTDELAMLDNLAIKTGLTRAEIIRRSFRYAIPRFEKGTVNLLKYGSPQAA